MSFFVIMAVCGLVLAGHPDLRQNRKAAHIANGRANRSSGSQWRWQNPLPQGNTLRGISLVDANTGTIVGDYGKSSGPRMAERPGRFSPVVRSKRYGAFSSQMQPTERLSAKMGRSFEPQMVALIGCRK